MSHPHWSGDTVRLVRSLYSRHHIERTVLVEMSQVAVEAQSRIVWGRLVDSFLEHARDSADVTLATQDLARQTWEDEPTGRQTMQVIWRPQVVDVELFGGRHDGKQLTLHRAGEVPACTELDLGLTPSRGQLPERFYLSGWCPEYRHWIYEMDR